MLHWQVTRSIYVRAVLEYDANRRDASRDDSRTNLPLGIRNPDTGGSSGPRPPVEE